MTQTLHDAAEAGTAGAVEVIKQLLRNSTADVNGKNSVSVSNTQQETRRLMFNVI